jgi:hypothetical protein
MLLIIIMIIYFCLGKNLLLKYGTEFVYVLLLDGTLKICTVTMLISYEICKYIYGDQKSVHIL